jgi:hypothetical protein
LTFVGSGKRGCANGAIRSRRKRTGGQPGQSQSAQSRQVGAAATKSLRAFQLRPRLTSVGLVLADGRRMAKRHILIIGGGVAGLSVVQVMLPSSCEYWATRKDRYASEKDAVAEALIDLLEPCFPNLRESVCMDRRVSGLSGAYLAGQWVAPGGGVPSAVLSGRQVVELICADHDRKFVAA